MNLLEVRDLQLSYEGPQGPVPVLKGVSLRVKRGDFIAIQGASGSGKSSLFYLLGGMLKPRSGRILFRGRDIVEMDESDLAHFRSEHLGFVFQQFHLMPRASVLENILLPCSYPAEVAPRSRGASVSRATELANQLGLAGLLDRTPNQLSGGQQQRVAIARALMKDPELILADEPTGNLDEQSALATMNLLKELNRAGKTIILITHDAGVAAQCKKVMHLNRGEFSERPSESGAESVEVESVARGQAETYRSSTLYRNCLRSALRNLWRTKWKAGFTALGVVVGIAATVSVVTLGGYIKAKVMAAYAGAGTNQAMVRARHNYRQRATDSVPRQFLEVDPATDLPRIATLPGVQKMSPSILYVGVKVTALGFGGGVLAKLQGVNEQYFSIMNRSLTRGEWIGSHHVANASPVCVLGPRLYTQLFGRRDPVGNVILAVRDDLSITCTVRGILAPDPSAGVFEPDLEIFVPYTYLRSVLGTTNGAIRDVALQVDPRLNTVVVGFRAVNYLKKKYGKSAIFSLDSNVAMVAHMNKFLNLFAMLLVTVALVTLGVGGIGVTNVMMVSVTDRVREFGLRRALGATSRSIRLQVLLESVALCAIAGVVGVLFGVASYEAAIYGANLFFPKSIPFEWVIDPRAILLAMAAIVAVGVVSGFFPAMRAERISVIEALRSE